MKRTDASSDDPLEAHISRVGQRLILCEHRVAHDRCPRGYLFCPPYQSEPSAALDLIKRRRRLLVFQGEVQLNGTRLGRGCPLRFGFHIETLRNRRHLAGR